MFWHVLGKNEWGEDVPSSVETDDGRYAPCVFDSEDKARSFAAESIESARLWGPISLKSLVENLKESGVKHVALNPSVPPVVSEIMPVEDFESLYRNDPS